MMAKAIKSTGARTFRGALAVALNRKEIKVKNVKTLMVN